MSTPEHQASKAFWAYTKGWKNGATAGDMDPRFTARDPEDRERVEYQAGYTEGCAARLAAVATATERSGHEPRVRTPAPPAFGSE
jgi:hypothetical protein